MSPGGARDLIGAAHSMPPAAALIFKDVQICHKGRLCTPEGVGDPRDVNELQCAAWYKMSPL
ncbi:hypothetical protein HMPREF9062_0526 [Actinomyces sp. oral taxon 448 str. F0400]|nr:hypothetical protein HMPREF9062_0526 [Actinomyces sp. oral taxon 448 str. F0400]